MVIVPIINLKRIINSKKIKTIFMIFMIVFCLFSLQVVKSIDIIRGRIRYRGEENDR